MRSSQCKLVLKGQITNTSEQQLSTCYILSMYCIPIKHKNMLRVTLSYGSTTSTETYTHVMSAGVPRRFTVTDSVSPK